MLPRMTSMQAEAQDAFSHTLASVGALTFVNAYSGSAAPPAPSNAFVERQLACPFLPLEHTPQEVTHDVSTSRAICGVRRHGLG